MSTVMLTPQEDSSDFKFTLTEISASVASKANKDSNQQLLFNSADQVCESIASLQAFVDE